MSEEIEERARRVVLMWSGEPREKITLDARFYEDLHGDSLDYVELIMAFEEEFGIEVSDYAAERVRTFGDAVALVRRTIGTDKAEGS